MHENKVISCISGKNFYLRKIIFGELYERVKTTSGRNDERQ